ncbi:MAG TPA: D-glycerate dehydrogenase [Patescibacteria group bacterium]|nr:D-glycerate dehydrogenase [Patescibacteria group bacterium]
MKIFVTRKIPGENIKALIDVGCTVDISPYDRPLEEEELVERVAGKDVILTLLTDRIDADLMDAAGPQLKIISNYAVGFDNIDIKAATDRGIVVTNTPSDEVNEAVAEHTWALILCLSRRIVEADEATRRGGYRGWEPDIFMGKSLIGKTLGIVGLGRIGTMVARRAIGYNMTLLYNKRTPDVEAEKKFGVQFVTLDELLTRSDYVTLHVPLTDETRGMMNSQTFSKMKQGSFMINTARGPVVSEHDLVEALRSGHLAGAALDVFENEPDINPELLGMENVILTPHIASATREARNKMGQQAITAILDVLQGKKPENIANPDVWEKRRK